MVTYDELESIYPVEQMDKVDVFLSFDLPVYHKWTVYKLSPITT